MVEFRDGPEFSKQKYNNLDRISHLAEIHELKRYGDETGSLTELIRLDRGNFQYSAINAVNVKQCNFCELRSFSIKAFHVHPTQTDLIYVPPTSKIKLVVADVRNGAADTKPYSIILGDHKSNLVRILPGTAHGFQNLLDDIGIIIYFVDFNFESDPDHKSFQEYRLPYDMFGVDIWREPTD